tara:strand:+ start:3347 stop:4309 length:963 start_codon:yes stop_codon:yes gene_type:complete
MMRFLIIILISLSQLLGKETNVQEIKLSGLITDGNQEISGMDWYQDRLFLLPENLGGFLFAIPKIEILNSIKSNEKMSITPKQTRFITPDYKNLINGFDGFEAIAFNGNKVFISIEAEHNEKMNSYIVWGEIDPSTLEIKIEQDHLKWVDTPIQIDNFSFESLLVYGDDILMIYEANGSNIQQDVQQVVFSPSSGKISFMDFTNIEYRITDATKINKNSKFWSINYFWPGDKKKLTPGQDKILNNVKQGRSHSKSNQVERLIEFEIKSSGISISDTEPIQLVLEPDMSRNWEALARLDNIGLLIATDKYPRMILGYVAFK